MVLVDPQCSPLGHRAPWLFTLWVDFPANPWTTRHFCPGAENMVPSLLRAATWLHFLLQMPSKVKELCHHCEARAQPYSVHSSFPGTLPNPLIFPSVSTAALVIPKGASSLQGFASVSFLKPQNNSSQSYPHDSTFGKQNPLTIHPALCTWLGRTWSDTFQS